MATSSQRLRLLREMRGLSQAELGDKVGVSRRVISSWELGRAIPADFVPVLASALGVSVCGFYNIPHPADAADDEAAYADVIGPAGDRWLLSFRDWLAGQLQVKRGGLRVVIAPTTEGDEYEPSYGAFFLRSLRTNWPQMTDTERQEVLDWADQERRRHAGDEAHETDTVP